MDLYLKQWRTQHESEQQPSAKMPKLLDPPQHQQQLPLASELPLFAPEPTSKLSNLSAFPDSNTASSRFPKMGSYFSLAQWQELELQALIFRYMLAGAAVPPELLQTIKKSLHSPAFFLHHPLQHFSHYQPSLLQAGYWGRVAMDPEPGRCRRTDGKKWRCSRDVMAGHKYCERHMHRGRNRSRKPVEIPTPTTSVAGGGGAAAGALKATASVAAPPMSGASHFALSGSSASVDLFHINQRSSEPKHDNKGLFEPQNEGDNRSDGHILRHFFDDWPRKLQESDQSNASPMNSATGLTISMPGNLPSDVSLKLSTGIGDEPGGSRHQNVEQEQPRLNWPAGWATNNVASMGGPLAEALRSSTSTSSPTSVLHQLQPRGSALETSFVSI